MPQLRVFVSSTAFDLGAVRGQLRNYILSLGHQPVLSEFSNVLYDPSTHTHEACVQELQTCDAVLLIVGSRWGSAARPEFVSRLDTELLDDSRGTLEDLVGSGNLSVTQLEAVTAFRFDIPVFAFVEDNVQSEARLYAANQDLADEGKINFPSVGNAETAKYIFKFLEYIESRSTGNAVVEFRQIEDIQSHLRQQWSSLLQRLLASGRSQAREQGIVEILSEKLDDMKAVLASSIGGPDVQRVASGVLEFRVLCDFLMTVQASEQVFLTSEYVDFYAFLDRIDLRKVTTVSSSHPSSTSGTTPLAFRRLLLEFPQYVIEVRLSEQRFFGLASDWEQFQGLSIEERQVIFRSLKENRSGLPMARRFEMTAEIEGVLNSTVPATYEEWRAATRRNVEKRYDPTSNELK